MDSKLTLTALVGAFVVGGALAQARVEPHVPSAPVASTAPPSAFEGYRPYRDEPVAPWREANDAVREAGGHIGILRSEQQDAAHPAAQKESGASGGARAAPSKQER
jgi:hypothetical protein